MKSYNCLSSNETHKNNNDEVMPPSLIKVHRRTGIRGIMGGEMIEESSGHCLTDNSAPTVTLDLRGSLVQTRWRKKGGGDVWLWCRKKERDAGIEWPAVVRCQAG